MIIPSIKRISVISNDGVMDVYNHGQDGITEILDKSLEFESSIEHIFYVIKSGTLSVKLVNVPVIVEYFK